MMIIQELNTNAKQCCHCLSYITELRNESLCQSSAFYVFIYLNILFMLLLLKGKKKKSNFESMFFYFPYLCKSCTKKKITNSINSCSTNHTFPFLFLPFFLFTPISLDSFLSLFSWNLERKKKWHKKMQVIII
jgi:hypothetical protein